MSNFQRFQVYRMDFVRRLKEVCFRHVLLADRRSRHTTGASLLRVRPPVLLQGVSRDSVLLSGMRCWPCFDVVEVAAIVSGVQALLPARAGSQRWVCHYPGIERCYSLGRHRSST